MNNQIIFQDENSLINDPVVAQTIDIPPPPPKSQEYINLELNLNKLKLSVNNLINFEGHSLQELNEHCRDQKRRVQSATEFQIKNLENKNKKRKYDEINNEEECIDQINRSSKELIEEIDDYEKACIKEFSHKTSTVKDSFSPLVEKVNKFLDLKQVYLKDKQINDDELRIFNLKSIEFQSKLNKELKKTKDLIFNNNKIEFIDNTDESITTSIGYFDYEERFNVSYFKFLKHILF